MRFNLGAADPTEIYLSSDDFHLSSGRGRCELPASARIWCRAPTRPQPPWPELVSGLRLHPQPPSRGLCVQHSLARLLEPLTRSQPPPGCAPEDTRPLGGTHVHAVRPPPPLSRSRALLGRSSHSRAWHSLARPLGPHGRSQPPPGRMPEA